MIHPLNKQLAKEIINTGHAVNNPYSTQLKYYHWAALFFYSSLIVLFSAHQWFRAEGISLVQWSVQSIPLLIFWFGLRKRHQRSYQYLCFVVLMYFINGVIGVMRPTPDYFDWILLIASVGLFIASMMAARAQYKQYLFNAEHSPT